MTIFNQAHLSFPRSAYVILFLFLAQFSGNVSAYNIYRDCPGLGTTYFRWQNPNINFDVRAVDFSNAQFNSMRAAGNEFDDIGGSNIDLNIFSSNVSSYFYGDGRNSIYWNNGGFSPNSIGFAKYTAAVGDVNDCSNIASPGFLIEADIWMRSNVNWTTSNQAFLFPTSSIGIHIGRAVMHELGHSVGLSGRSLTSTGANSGQASSHENDLVATMNSRVPGGSILGGNRSGNSLGTFRNKLHADEAAALRLMYPAAGTRYDVAGSRFRTDGNGRVIQNSSVTPSLQIRRGSGYFLPYTVQNLGTNTQDVRIDVWMTRDGVLDGNGTDIQLTNNGAPLFHIYTMNAIGRVPGLPANASQSSTREGSIYFLIPNDATTFPNSSQWLIGYNVSSPYLPGGASDADTDDNWVSLRLTHTIVP